MLPKCHFKTMPVYGARLAQADHTGFFEMEQAVYLRFYYFGIAYGWGFAIQPRKPA